MKTWWWCDVCRDARETGLCLSDYGCDRCGKPRKQVQVVDLDAVVALPGSRLWAIAKALEGKRVGFPGSCFGSWGAKDIAALPPGPPETEWYEWPPDPPPWKPGVGERVRGWRGKVELIGQYAGTDSGGHLIGDPGCLPFWVERVEPVNEGARG